MWLNPIDMRPDSTREPPSPTQSSALGWILNRKLPSTCPNVLGDSHAECRMRYTPIYPAFLDCPRSCPNMSLPKFQYAGGANIAFHVLGSGSAVVFLFPYHVNHLILNWNVPLHRGAIEYLSRHFSVINLDFRGAGVSRGSARSLSLEKLSNDLQSVLACSGVRQIALCAVGDASLVACDFACRFRDRVKSMVFIAAGESEINRRVLALRHVNPDLEARLRGALLGVDDKRNASALATVARNAISSAALQRWEKVLLESSLYQLARQVRVPVLWLHASNDELVDVHHVKHIVEQIQNAELVMVPGRSGMDIWRDRAVMSTIIEFVGKGFGYDIDPPSARRRRPLKVVCYPNGLSEREVEVLRSVVAGHTNKQISEHLFISLNTVSYHLRSIFNKTGASNRTEAASFAYRYGICGSAAS